MTSHIPDCLHAWARDEDTPIPSPCIRICKVDSTLDLCTGCYRTRAELKRWMGSTNAEKLQILEDLIARRVHMGTAGQPHERAARPAASVTKA